MKTGRRITNPSPKMLAGTYRKDRHADIMGLAAPARNEPVMPAYLTVGAKLVWNKEMRRVAACGVTEADSSLFARYWECEAAFRIEVLAGGLPKSALLTELRRMAELLGIAGLRSRLARTGGTDAPKSGFKMMPK